MSDTYSTRAALAIKEAKNLAILHSNPEITDIHLHLSLIKQKNTLVSQALEEFNIDVDKYIENLEDVIEQLPSKPGLQNLYYSRNYQKTLLIAKEISKSTYDYSIGIDHLYLALFSLEKSTSKYILNKMYICYESMYQYIVSEREAIGVSDKYPEGISNVLRQYGKDLTEDAKQGKLDPVIGMDDEINRIIRVLNRRIKNNPIIVGEPGVGKTAVVEGLAQRIVNQDVPASLRKSNIFSLNMGSLVAGAKLRGEFEERIHEVLDIIANSNGRIILFIDEIHTIVNSGSSGSLDASNILKPMLSRGEILTIGATTLDEYTKYIEKDGALERRFQRIYVKEPSWEETVSILRGTKNKYEVYHGLKIQDQALVACAYLSYRFINDRFLPDKAIDVLDEACSMVRTEIDAMPLELDEMKRKILQLEIDRISLKEEDDIRSRERLKHVEKEISVLSGKFESEKKHWKEDKKNISEIKKIDSEIVELNRKIEEANSKDDFKKLTYFKYVKLPELKEKERKLLNKEYRYTIFEEVTEANIREVISKATGIPVNKLEQDDKKKILNLEKT